ncbi:hypothetical protein PVAND_009564 [Polypedilum vanderplanki]|uniref:DUF4203 domain-containing protein n=1 Tax=Polypedilum vanderplanki TaxID=319348 RepID=A0A9J6CDY7_POLVA|nr:hypothetical protein PVAND_009564 [Polypedilum vanderplanki]
MLLIYGLLVFLQFFKFSYQFTDKIVRIKITNATDDQNEMIFIDRIDLSARQSVIINVEKFNNSHFDFATIQIHSYYQNLTIFDDDNEDIYYEAHIGFIINFNDSNSKTLKISNENHDTKHILVALIGYKDSSPTPGGCSVKKDKPNNINLYMTEETDNFLILSTPAASEAQHILCDDSDLLYDTYYTYIDQLDFSIDSYFDALEKMIFTEIFSTYHVKNIVSSRKHMFEAVAGRGLIVNTVVRNRKTGEMAFYLPFVTYSCPQNTWLAHCSNMSFLKRGIGIVLAIHSVVTMLNLMVPDFIEAVLNGLLYGGYLAIVVVQTNSFPLKYFDYFIVIFVCSLFCGAILGTISLYWHNGRYFSKFTFCNIFVIFMIECCFENVTSIYLQTLLSIVLSIFMSYIDMTFSAFIGTFVLILDISFLIEIGNLHRIIINNFVAYTTVPSHIGMPFSYYIRPNFINYKVPLNLIDYAFIVFFVIFSIYLTLRKQKYFMTHPSVFGIIFPQASEVNTFNLENARRRHENCIMAAHRELEEHTRRISRSRRLHRFNPQILINGRTPALSSPWLTSEGDDDVFETPQSAQYLQILAATPSNNTIADDEIELDIENSDC